MVDNAQGGQHDRNGQKSPKNGRLWPKIQKKNGPKIVPNGPKRGEKGTGLAGSETAQVFGPDRTWKKREKNWPKKCGYG